MEIPSMNKAEAATNITDVHLTVCLHQHAQHSMGISKGVSQDKGMGTQ